MTPLDLNAGDILTGRPRAKGAASGGKRWAPIYDVDFTTLPFQQFTVAGKYTLKEVDWWAKNPQNGTWQITAANGWEMAAANVATDVGNWIGTPRQYVLPLVNVPGWNPNAPTQFWCVQKYAYTPFSSSAIMLGVADTTSDTVGMTAAQRDRNMSLALETSSSNTNRISWTRDNLRTGQADLPFQHNNNTWPTVAVGLCLASAYNTYGVVDGAFVPGGPLPPKEPFEYPYLYGYGHAARANTCLWLAPPATGQQMSVLRLAILQPSKD